MADQTVRITNLPESSAIERVAFDLMEKIIFKDKSEKFETKKEIINLYVDCLSAVRNYQKVD